MLDLCPIQATETTASASASVPLQMDWFCLLGMVLLRPGRLPAGFGWLSDYECLGASSPSGLPQLCA